MTNSNEILNNLRNSKRFAKLKQQNCFDFIKKLLPPMLNKQIRFIYHKGDTIFLVLNHPGIKMEIDYRLKSIKELLKDALAQSCNNLSIANIKTFVTNKPLMKETAKKVTVVKYAERSSGDFENNLKDKKMYALFEEIKKQIRSQ